jgi:hypothetical protein
MECAALCALRFSARGCALTQLTDQLRFDSGVLSARALPKIAFQFLR